MAVYDKQPTCSLVIQIFPCFFDILHFYISIVGLTSLISSLIVLMVVHLNRNAIVSTLLLNKSFLLLGLPCYQFLYIYIYIYIYSHTHTHTCTHTTTHTHKYCIHSFWVFLTRSNLFFFPGVKRRESYSVSPNFSRCTVWMISIL